LPPLQYDPKEAKDWLKRSGYRNEPIYIETTNGYTANDKAMSEAITAMWRDIGLNVVLESIEYSVRAQKNRERSFKGLWWSDPVSTTGDPDGMMWRLLAPGAVHDYWRDPEFDRLGDAARYSLDEKFRGEAYKRMTQLFLEHHPWIIVIQPYESFGLQKYVEFQAHPVQLVELRRFNLGIRRS
jgi:peptide/nickel transport system substrate-binding protein